MIKSNAEFSKDASLSIEALASAVHFALLHEERGNYDTAAAAFKSLQIVDPLNPYFHAMLGVIYQKQADYENAIRYYTEAIKIFPTDVETLTNLGEIFLRTERLQEAVHHLKQAVDLDSEANHPSANRARLLLAYILKVESLP